MRNEDKTREQLIEELNELQQQSAKSEFENISGISIIENSPIIAYTCTADENFAAIDVSNNLTRLTGYQREDFLSNPTFWIDRIHPDDKESVFDYLDRWLHEKESHTLEYRVQIADGSYRWIIDSLKVVKPDDTSYIEGWWYDITAQKEAEEELSKTTEQLSTLLTSLPVIPYTARADGDFGATYISPGVFKVTGYQPEDFTSNADFWTDRIHPDDTQRVFSGLDEVFEKEQLEIEYRFRVADGNYRWFSDVLRLVRKQNGEVDHLAGVWHDITERKQLEEQLRQSQKMESLGTLAGGIAHDFNNILGMILGNTEMGMKDFPEDGKARKHLERIHKSGKRAANLVRQIMTFSRMGKTSFKPLNLTLVIHEALSMVRATLPANIQIQQNLLEYCPAISADETQIHQIILNLCSNAHHAMEDTGGTLEITLEEVRDCPSSMGVVDVGCLKLTVKDSGKGIELDDQTRIFDPFFTTKEVGKGTGLGLAVVHGIMKEHQGKIMVASRRDKGTTFSLFFSTIETEIQDTHVQDSAAKKGKGHILIVEDEPELVNLYQEFLEGLDYVVTAYSDGIDALAKFRQNPNQFDLVLTDHAMPNITGKQLIPKLLDIRSNIPIILSTGYSDLMSEEEPQALGIRKYLIKPLKLFLLQDTIDECLS